MKDEIATTRLGAGVLSLSGLDACVGADPTASSPGLSEGGFLLTSERCVVVAKSDDSVSIFLPKTAIHAIAQWKAQQLPDLKKTMEWLMGILG